MKKISKEHKSIITDIKELLENNIEICNEDINYFIFEVIKTHSFEKQFININLLNEEIKNQLNNLIKNDINKSILEQIKKLNSKERVMRIIEDFKNILENYTYETPGTYFKIYKDFKKIVINYPEISNKAISKVGSLKDCTFGYINFNDVDILVKNVFKSGNPYKKDIIKLIKNIIDQKMLLAFTVIIFSKEFTNTYNVLNEYTDNESDGQFEFELDLSIGSFNYNIDLEFVI